MRMSAVEPVVKDIRFYNIFPIEQVSLYGFSRETDSFIDIFHAVAKDVVAMDVDWFLIFHSGYSGFY